MKLKNIKDRKTACGPDELDLQPAVPEDEYWVEGGDESNPAPGAE